MNLSSLADLDLFACCVYAEARGEPEEGKRAVAGVIRNRSARRKQSFRQVILASKQFSWTNPRDPNYQTALTACAQQTAAWLKCKVIVVEASFNLNYYDTSLGADHYLNDVLVLKLYGKLPTWAREGIANGQVTTRIRNHLFLNLEGKR